MRRRGRRARQGRRRDGGRRFGGDRGVVGKLGDPGRRLVIACRSLHARLGLLHLLDGLRLLRLGGLRLFPRRRRSRTTCWSGRATTGP